MTHFSRLILSSSAAALFAMPSMAQVTYANDINNVQKNWAEIRAELNADMTAITGDVELTSAAIANSLSVEASGSTDAFNDQISGGEVTDVDGNVTVKTTNISSDLDIDPTDSLASLKGTSAAIANSASYEFTGGVDTANVVNSTQYANANTVSDLDANLNGVSGDTELTSAAIANSLSVTSDLTTGLDNTQTSFGDTTATLDLVSTASMGKVAATAAAIGNSASVSWETGMGAGAVDNEQSLDGIVSSALTVTNSIDTSGDVELVSAAIGNSLSVEGDGFFLADNIQTSDYTGTSTDVSGATSNVDIDNVTGLVDVTTAGINNSASYEISASAGLTNSQTANNAIAATSNIDLNTVTGDVNVTTAGIGNSYSVSTLPTTTTLTVNSTQINDASSVTATTGVEGLDLIGITGNVTATSAAIGNSLSISIGDVTE